MDTPALDVVLSTVADSLDATYRLDGRPRPLTDFTGVVALAPSTYFEWRAVSLGDNYGIELASEDVVHTHSVSYFAQALAADRYRPAVESDGAVRTAVPVGAGDESGTGGDDGAQSGSAAAGDGDESSAEDGDREWPEREASDEGANDDDTADTDEVDDLRAVALDASQNQYIRENAIRSLAECGSRGAAALAEIRDEGVTAAERELAGTLADE